MDDISLESRDTGSVTCVSNMFIDEYMAQANGEFIKIYLYLLRCINQAQLSCSVCQIADRFEHTEKDVIRALRYWEKMKLIQLRFNEQQEITGICLLPFPASTSPVPPTGRNKTSSLSDTATSESASSDSANTTIPTYTRDQLAAFSEQDEIRELFFIIESYLKRTLNATDCNSILYWYDGLHFSADVIEYLVEYCVTRSHTSIRYMEKIALSWADAGVHSVEDAKKNSTLHSQANFAVMKALGIRGRNLVELEVAMIQKWTQEYGFTLDIILEACSRTITATHQPSFEYTDKILSNWHKGEVKHLEDISALDSQYQKAKKRAATAPAKAGNDGKFSNFTQRTYDYEQLEQQLLSRSKN